MKLELLKNRFLYLNEIAPIPKGINEISFEQQKEALKLQINDAWKVIYEYLGKNKLLSDDVFLQNHYFMYFKYDVDTSSKCTSLLLSEEFTITGILTHTFYLGKIEEYVKSISESVVAWFNIKNPEYNYPVSNSHLNLHTDIATWLVKLDRLPFSPFSTCLMAWMVKGVNNKDLLEIIQLMERYTFLVFKVSRCGSHTGKNLFYARAEKICDGTVNLAAFKRELIASTTRNIIATPVRNNRTLIDSFVLYIQRLFNQQINPRQAAAMPDGFSSWDGLRYFLFEYELFLQEDQPEKITWEDFKQLEHIFSAPTMPDWMNVFGKFSTDRQIKLCHSLGNLLYMNKKTQPSPLVDFEGKKLDNTDKKTTRGYTVSSASYSEIEVANNQDWTEAEILARGIEMLTFMEIRWDITIGNDVIKQQVLFL